MRITFLGTGDAFGSGGRFNTCFYVEADRSTFVIDCGASSLIAMKKYGVDPNSIDTIVITHAHGDHFGGLPYFILDAQLVSRRTKPLFIVGPDGLKGALAAMMEACFPGSSAVRRKFEIELVSLDEHRPTAVKDLVIHAVPVLHPSGETSTLAVRVECAGKVIAYTADTEWVEALVEIGRSADVLVAEAYTFERKVRYHLDLATLLQQLPRMQPKRLILTHMSTDMLERIDRIEYECAYDGMQLTI